MNDKKYNGDDKEEYDIDDSPYFEYFECGWLVDNKIGFFANLM